MVEFSQPLYISICKVFIYSMNEYSSYFTFFYKYDTLMVNVFIDNLYDFMDKELCFFGMWHKVLR